MSDIGIAFALAAEGFVGTPFRFRGRDPGTGLDCLGLITVSLHTLGIRMPAIPPYAMRQSDFAAQLNGAAVAGFEEVDGDLSPGDLLLLRPGPAQLHLAVVDQRDWLIHAHAGLRRVVTTPPPCPWPIERHWRLREN